MVNIFPKVKEIKYNNDVYKMKEKSIAFFDRPNEIVKKELDSFLNLQIGKTKKADVRFFIDRKLNPEAYKIAVTKDGITIYHKDDSGAFYAVKTLKQIIKNNQIECLEIFDEPDLKIRGFMYDISRNKVPKLETVFKIIDIMSDLKMNHLELYVEGFSFEYQSFKEYLKKDSYITVEEYKAIEDYANKHFIDLVPNQNGFGHMASWLKKEEFSSLAECPEGIHLWGTHRAPSTLNPLDPKSLELLKKMYQDMLPHSTSKYFNMNFDEPFELGKGKSKEECERVGLGKVYLDYTLKAYKEIKRYKKIPLIWGDVLNNHPELFKKLPKDMIFIDWGYDAFYSFSKNIKKLKKAKVKFMAAPGTTSWCSLSLRQSDWIENIANACWAVKDNGGEGVLLTDWGDVGHMQMLPFSFAPLVYAGLMSYRCEEGVYLSVKQYLNKFVFKDKENLIADAIMDLGTINRFENNYIGNGTATFYMLLWITYSFKEENMLEYVKEKMKYNTLSYKKYQSAEEYLNYKKKEIELIKFSDSLIKEEIVWTIEMLSLLLKINVCGNESLDKNIRITLSKEAIKEAKKIKTDLSRLWLQRNKQSSLDETLDYIEKLIKFSEERLKYIEGVKK